MAGTFKERAGFHGCQMPEQLLGRIIKCSSNEGEMVLDPFVGSGTTMAVAKKLGREWVGFEMSKEYVKQVRSRLEKIESGDPLNGAADPLSSVPDTANGKVRANGKRTKQRAGKREPPTDEDTAPLFKMG